MAKKLLIAAAGVVSGLIAAYCLLLIYPFKSNSRITNNNSKSTTLPQKRVVIGFLPFWLIDKAQPDYSKYITQLSYFNVVVDEDGFLQKFTSPGESDPGWHALSLGKVDNYLKSAKNKGLDLSLTVFSSSDNKINAMLEDPEQSAENLVADLGSIISKHGFSDINLDIEKVGESDSSQRYNYFLFVKKVRELLPKSVSVTVDAPPIAFVKDKNLVDPKLIAQTADYVVLMGYDFHNPSSFVTGAVAPLSGAGIINEYDIQSATQFALNLVPKSKLILALPLYGYAWETIGSTPRSAVMPGSAYSISNRLVEELLTECATCSADINEYDKEPGIIYKDQETGLYRQIFYPDLASTKLKLEFASKTGIRGVALWALGYEGATILDPLSLYVNYK